MKNVPVISDKGEPLMPTSASRARHFIKSKEATPFYKLGIFCIRMNKAVNNHLQPIVCTSDPGSKKEGLTIKCKSQTYLNIQCDARTGIKEKLETRRNMRRGRRFRKTPCRAPRWSNRGNSQRINRVSPSTKARWDLKINLIQKLQSIYPITKIGIEDIQAESKKGKKKWNESFSPLEVGKKYAYTKLNNLAPTKLYHGYETANLRKKLGLIKCAKKHKMENRFDAHCIDTWVLANDMVGGHNKPDNTEVIYLTPAAFSRRQLHVFQPAKKGIRKRSGGTRSLGFTRGAIVKHINPSKTLLKYNSKGVFLIGGYDDKTGKISLRQIGSYKTDDRIGSAKPSDLKLIAYNKFRIKL